MKKIILYSLTGAVLLLCATVAYTASFTSNDLKSSRVDAGATFCIDSTAFNPTFKQQVKNSGSGAVFVPHRDISEWNSFTAHLPAGVTITSCAVPPPPVPPNLAGCGYCWWYQNYWTEWCHYWPQDQPTAIAMNWDGNKDAWFTQKFNQAWIDDAGGCRSSAACVADKQSAACLLCVARQGRQYLQNQGTIFYFADPWGDPSCP